MPNQEVLGKFFLDNLTYCERCFRMANVVYLNDETCFCKQYH